jgi:hypothetical protein
MAKIEEHFHGSSKSNASILMTKMMQAKYDGRGSVREHILKMIDMLNKLKDLECPLPDPSVIHCVMMSLPPVLGILRLVIIQVIRSGLYMTELIAKLSQEEERLRVMNGGNIVNFVKDSSSGHGKYGGKFSHQKGKGKSHLKMSKKLSKKMSLMKRKVPSASIIKNMGTRWDCDDFKA